MAANQKWTNEDGLVVRFGRNAQEYLARPRKYSTAGDVQELVVNFTYDNLPTFDKDADNDGTDDSFERLGASIPAGPDGVYIKSATLFAVEDWATADSAVLNLELYEEDGTEMSSGTGIDAAIAASALDTGDVVACDGALVGTTMAASTAPYFIGATITVGSFTTGKAKLVVEYQKLGFPETAPATGTVTVS
jgi:hypothetical protein